MPTPSPKPARPAPSPFPELDRAMRELILVPKAAVVAAERKERKVKAKGKRKQ